MLDRLKQMMNWPNKDEREGYEIQTFIDHYKRLPSRIEFIVIEKREKPDYFVKDKNKEEYYGVELTSVYLSDTSVRDNHIPTLNEKGIPIPFNRDEIEKYKNRIINSIRDKVQKASTLYDRRYRLILSIYVNEYIEIFMDRNEWSAFVKEHKAVFNAMYPFTQVFFWGIGNHDALLVTPD